MEYLAHVRKSDLGTQMLYEHLTGVSKICAFLAAKFGLEIFGELQGLMHDFGKYSFLFQCYLLSATELIKPGHAHYVDAIALKGKVDHSTAGAQFVWNELSKQGAWESCVGQILALCIASHHSGLIDCIAPNGEASFIKRMSKKSESSFIDEAIASADSAILERANTLLKSPQLIEGMRGALLKIIKSDSVTKDTLKGEKSIQHQQIGLLVRLLFSCLIDADRLDSANFEKPKAALLRLNGVYEKWGFWRSVLKSIWLNSLS